MKLRTIITSATTVAIAAFAGWYAYQIKKFDQEMAEYTAKLKADNEKIARNPVGMDLYPAGVTEDQLATGLTPGQAWANALLAAADESTQDILGRLADGIHIEPIKIDRNELKKSWDEGPGKALRESHDRIRRNLGDSDQ